MTASARNLVPSVFFFGAVSAKAGFTSFPLVKGREEPRTLSSAPDLIVFLLLALLGTSERDVTSLILSLPAGAELTILLP